MASNISGGRRTGRVFDLLLVDRADGCRGHFTHQILVASVGDDSPNRPV